MTIKVCLDQLSAADTQYASLALDVLAEGIGVNWRPASSAQADVVYSPVPPSGSDAVWIRAETSKSWRPEHFAPDDFALPPSETAACPSDVIRGTYLAVTGGLEAEWPKNPRGVPLARGVDALRTAFVATPYVAAAVAYLDSQLRRLRPASVADAVGRWPDGKRYAVVLTHDIDAPFSYRHFAYMAKLAKRMARQHSWKALAQVIGSTGKTGMLRMAGRYPAPSADPNLRFDDWLEVGREIGSRHSLYVAVRTPADEGGSPLDVTYDFRHPLIVAGLRKGAEEGWDVGLHASICARESNARFAEEKAWLESAIGRRVRGLRHHYWNINSDRPEETLRFQGEAGFEYDTSLSLNDGPGFRRGMAWPFHPIDPATRERLPILEIPPTIMDGAIFYRDVTPEQGFAEIKEHVAGVFRWGGAVVFNWHAEQLNPLRMRGAGPVLLRVLRDLVEDGEIYWCSAAEMTDWWSERRRRIDGMANR